MAESMDAKHIRSRSFMHSKRGGRVVQQIFTAMSKCALLARHRCEASSPMFTVYLIVTVLAAAANTYAAIVDFRRPQWILDNMTDWGGSHSWLFTLGALKAAGALGLLVGIGVPLIGIAAAIGLVVFFVGAIVVVIRAHWYSHLPWPATYLLLAMVSLTLRLAVQ
jgi:DoxX-like family